MNRNNEMSFDKGNLVCIWEGVSFCFCTHVIMCMVEAYIENAISLPFGGLISKILKARLQNILASENMNVPLGRFGKAMATIQKLDA
jgi:hypothetical protein